MRISVLVDVNSVEHLKACLYTLSKQDIQIYTFAIDNGTNQAEVIFKEFPELNYKIHKLPSNHAYIINKCAELAIEAGSDYLYIMNPNDYVSYRFIRVLLGNVQGFDMVTHDSILFNKDNLRGWEVMSEKFEVKDLLIKKFRLGLMSIKVWQELHGFDSRKKDMAELDFAMRFLQAGYKFKIVKDDFYYQRIESAEPINFEKNRSYLLGQHVL